MESSDFYASPTPQQSPLPPPAESPSFEDTAAPEPEKESKHSSGLRGLFGEGFRLPELDADTVMLLILVYFLLGDDQTDHISDTLLIIGVLLLLGF